MNGAGAFLPHPLLRCHLHDKVIKNTVAINTNVYHHSFMKPTPFLDRREGLDVTRNYLPHWDQTNRFQFITWSLADALPGKALQRLEREKVRWLQCHPKPWKSEEASIYYERYVDRVDRWLAQGRGDSLFQYPENAEFLAKVLMFYEGKQTRMDAFVIMPNHVHCLVFLMKGMSLPRLMKSWRGYSARELNRQYGKTGRFWNVAFWDTVPRSPEHYKRIRSYIEANPRKANLPLGSYRLWIRPTPLWEDLKQEGFGLHPEFGNLMA